MICNKSDLSELQIQMNEICRPTIMGFGCTDNENEPSFLRKFTEVFIKLKHPFGLLAFVKIYLVSFHEGMRK